MTKKTNQITIPPKAEVKIEWKDFPHNFSKEGIKQIKNDFSNKYNVDLKRIKVIQIPIKLNKSNEKVVWSDGLVENMLNLDNQHKLYKEWLKNEGIEDYDWDKILELDSIANSSIVSSVTDENCGLIWEPIEMGLSNFLSFGEDIVVQWNEYNGLTLITSEPANQGGKTNLCVDAPMFVLFGSTTKTDKIEEIFNSYSGKDRVNVYLILKAFGETYKIDRTLTRKAKKAGGYTVNNKVQYYKILDNGSEYELADDEQEIENQEGEQARETNKLIKNLIGSKDDFENVICATSKSLDNLIDSKVIGGAERGKLLNKFIGLEVFDQKYAVINELAKTFKKSMQSNVFNKATLETEIEANKTQIETNLTSITNKEKEILEKDKTITALEGQKNTLMQSKHQIDVDVLKLDSNSTKIKLTTDTNSGLAKKAEKEKLEKEKESLPNLVFDKEEYDKLTKEDKDLSIEESNLKLSNKNLKTENENLEKAKVCPTCNRPMEGVNNEAKIKENQETITKNQTRLEEIKSRLSEIEKSKDKLDKIKADNERRDKIELLVSKLNVDMGLLRESILANRALLVKYEENKEWIDKNNEIDQKIQIVTANLSTENNHKTSILSSIDTLKNDNKQLAKDNDEKALRIKKIDEEEKTLKEYNLYLSIVDSKRGVGKIVLRNTLPVINYTINEMLGDDVVDFDVEMDINANNDVEIYIVRDNIRNKIKSGSGYESVAVAIALRVVFSRLTTLPKPNFLILDEIFGGKVAEENFERIFLVIDKMKKYFTTLFLVTHDEKAKEYSDKTIIINKKDKISYIK